MATDMGIRIEDLPDAALIIDRDGSILEANEHADRLFGCERGGLVGLGLETLIPERFRLRHAELRGAYASNPVGSPMGSGREFTALSRDGREIPVEVGIGPIRGVAHVIALVRDISSTLDARKALEDSERRFRCAAESTADLIWEGDTTTGSIEWFGDIDGLLGFESGEFERTISGWLESVHPDDRDEVQQSLQKSIDTGVYELPSYRIRCKDGSYRFWEDHGKITEMVDGKAIRGVGAITDVTDRVLARQELERALTEIAQLKDRYQAESEYFQREIKSEHDFEEIVGNGAAMMRMLQLAELVAKTESTVLLLGETGTGKELLARAIHARSPRGDRPLIKVDCGTLPSGLIESELFGHERGAFTGAHESKAGLFELGHEGTVFLDEIGELPLELQSKLLRVLEDGEFQRVGSTQVRRVDVRIIAATHHDLERDAGEGRFRSDLYFRLGVFPIRCPSLRERREDLPLLVSYLASKCSAALGKEIKSVASESMEALVAYDWPGNVRELRNVIERSAILCTGDTLELSEVLGRADAGAPADENRLKQDLDAVERSRILEALEASSWRIKGEGNAASRLGLPPSTLRSKMKKLGIKRA